MDVVELTRDLILTESHTHVQPIFSQVSEMLIDLGADIRVCGPKKTPAFLAEFGGGGLVFSGHLDTVVMGEWDVEQGTIKDGKLYGRGSSDMKSGCAAMIAAAEILKDDIPFSLAFTTDEEIGMKGAEALAMLPQLQDAPMIVVGEPTGLQVGTGEKGVLWLKGTVQGNPSHGSMPWIGENAILAMIDHLKSITPYTEKDGMTINIGLIEGGQQINVTADSCTVQFDVRYPPTMTREEVIVDMETRTGLSLEEMYHLSPISIDPSESRVNLLSELSRGLCTCYYATEAIKYTPTPTVILGPGEMEMAHQKNEYVHIWQIEEAVEIYTDYARKLLSQ
jgi:acetylornithine deacetylase/succinyl-diaminopimelate desuccinylase-like protein